jgi:hypothetical protein
MAEKLDRRGAARAAAVTGGLLMLGGLAAADDERPTSLTGEWFNKGKLDQPCAVIQHGSVLLLINEKGDVAVGRLTEANKFAIIKGWKDGIVGKFDRLGKVIAWEGGGSWRKG